MIGKYEREDNLRSVEVIVKLAKAFEISPDFLLGEGQNATYDKDMVKRTDDLENLPKEESLRISHYMDLIIRNFTTKATYATKQLLS